ncbi:hypothetical protein PMAYCL1PPCAC_17797, partial [Pristionchus mayeri]
SFGSLIRTRKSPSQRRSTLMSSRGSSPWYHGAAEREPSVIWSGQRGDHSRGRREEGISWE